MILPKNANLGAFLKLGVTFCNLGVEKGVEKGVSMKKQSY